MRGLQKVLGSSPPCWTCSEEKHRSTLPQSHGAPSEETPPAPLKGIAETAPVLTE